MLAVAGGVYREICISPHWDQIYGSGGRAAALLCGFTDKVKLATYFPDNISSELDALGRTFGFSVQRLPSTTLITFDYFHTLSSPLITPERGGIKQNPPIALDEELVLRFGFMEGDVVINADRAVYDPQSIMPVFFSANGSKAKSLAIILNQHEARILSGKRSLDDAAKTIRQHDQAEVIIIKCGSQGARVYHDNRLDIIPAFKTPRVWKIGSGDVFSAAFTYFWGKEKIDPASAALEASKTTAIFCNHHAILPIPKSELASFAYEKTIPTLGLIYLAGPFFTISQRWLIEEARNQLLAHGCKVFSPLHDVGHGYAMDVAPKDIEGLKKCDVVLALADGADLGTIFEIGYARALNKPVIVISERLCEEDKKMIIGSNCRVFNDFTTAIYNTIWSLPHENGAAS